MFDLFAGGKFFLGAVLCNIIGLLSSFFSGIFQGGYFGATSSLVGGDYPSPNPWYATLVKPSVWPPNFLFGPVWFSLYTIMGIGAVLIIQSFGVISIPFGLFVFQLALNFIWSIAFFNWNRITVSLFILYLLDIVYFAMLFFVFSGLLSNVVNVLDPEILKTASFVGCVFMLAIPFLLLPVLKNAISSISIFPTSIRENILPWIALILIDVVLAYLLFGLLNVPKLYSNLSNNFAIFVMLFPTMLWISFATYLNFKIKQLNEPV
jgi:tryptophan-rich sensory protein